MDHNLLGHNVEIVNCFKSLTANTKVLLTNSWWKFIRQSKLVKTCKSEISNIYSRFFDFEYLNINFNNRRNFFLNYIKEHRYLSGIFKYLEEISEPDIQLPESIYSALNYLDKEVHTYINIRAIIFASIAGAIVGAIVASILV